MPIKKKIEKIEKAPKADSFDVLGNDGGVIRTYSVELHGADAEKLANQYAGKIGGKVR